VSELEYKGMPAAGNLRRAGQVVVAVLLAAAIATAWRWRGSFKPAELAAIIGAYPAAPVAFLLLHVVASLTFLPRTVLGLAAGVLFGVWWGLLWASLGAVIGALAGFLLARYVHSGLFERRRWARFTRLLERAERGGWRTVTLIRLVPVIPHSLANYALGLTRVRVGDFALGSLLGQLPMTVAAVELGAAGESAMRGGAWVWPTATGACALALSLVIPIAARRRKVRQA
jgi:uncharacterized membrane protein YdjX (TVP38/TMEM64 family)